MYSSEMIIDLFKKEALPGKRCKDQDIYLTEDQVFLALNTLIEEKKFNKEHDVPNWEIWLHFDHICLERNQTCRTKYIFTRIEQVHVQG